ncbi:MAG: aminopeptidase P family protein [Candidatus Diapherotrites archaeon]|nr:aminopeptidase P family protein [Candidatus Diapherotrites archaeon]
MKEKIAELFRISGAKAVFLRRGSNSKDPNFTYFSGLPENMAESAFMVLNSGSRPAVFTNVLDFGQLRKAHGITVKKIEGREKFFSVLKKAAPAKKIGFNADTVSVNYLGMLKRGLKGKKFVDVSEQLEKVRETKTAHEIRLVAKAVKISEKAADAIPDFFRPGMTEKQLAEKIESELFAGGAEGLAFNTIVASGKGASVPHYVPQAKKIGNGFLLVDFGGKYRNYCADLSRTFFAGRADTKGKEIYETVFEAKTLSQQLIREGAKAKDIFLQADNFLKEHLGKGMQHGLGHGLGIEVHDSPSGFLANSKDVLRNAMVLTVEPGHYWNGGGVRIEDDVVVSGRGCKALSKAPAELIEL